MHFTFDAHFQRSHSLIRSDYIRECESKMYPKKSAFNLSHIRCLTNAAHSKIMHATPKSSFGFFAPTCFYMRGTSFCIKIRNSMPPYSHKQVALIRFLFFFVFVLLNYEKNSHDMCVLWFRCCFCGVCETIYECCLQENLWWIEKQIFEVWLLSMTCTSLRLYAIESIRIRREPVAGESYGIYGREIYVHWKWVITIWANQYE